MMAGTKEELRAYINHNFASLPSEEAKLLFSLICFSGCAATKLEKREFSFLKEQFLKNKELQKLKLFKLNNRFFLRNNLKAFIVNECAYPKKEFDKSFNKLGLGTEDKTYTGFNKFGSDSLGFEAVQAIFGISAFINGVSLFEHLTTFLKDNHNTQRKDNWPLNNEYVSKLVSALLHEDKSFGTETTSVPEIKKTQINRTLQNSPVADEEWLSATNEIAIPFIGRQKELAELDKFSKYYGDNDQFRVWAVVGASGAGKTRLLNHWSLSLQKNAWEHIKISPDTRIDWDNWNPDYSTLISVDYIYGYDEVIAAIASRAQNIVFKHPVRLLLLDHATPDSMKALLRDPRWGFDERGSDNFINCFYKNEPLKLIPPDSNDEELYSEYERFLAKIICVVARRGEDNPLRFLNSPEIQRGLAYLKQTTGAMQALFAALVGNAIRQNKQKASDINDYIALNRRELIEHYFQGSNRLTWKLKGKDRVLGKWVACTVAAATAIRGAKFRALVQGIHEKAQDTIEHFEKFKSLCNGIVSGGNDLIIKAYEPDILGETFFLKFLHECPDLEKHLPNLIIAGAGKDKSQSAVEFVAFITRLARNLLNDDQYSASTIQAWELLADLLQARSFVNDPHFRWAVALSCYEVFQLLDDKKQHDLANQFYRLVNAEHLYKAPVEILSDRFVLLIIEYFELQNSVQDHPIPDELKHLLFMWDSSNRNIYSSFQLALVAMSFKIMHYLIEEGRAIASVSRSGITALMIACRNGQTELALAFVDIGENLDSQTVEGWTALMIACRNEQPEVALRLIEKGANLDVQNNHKWTALMLACEGGMCKVALRLIEKGANLGVQNNHKWTALMMACEGDMPEVALKLIEKGANLGAQNNENWTALMMACERGMSEVALRLIEKDANLGAQNNQKWTALMLACRKKQAAIGLALVQKDANLSAINNLNSTALMIACLNKQNEIALALVEKDANLNARNSLHTTALFIACDKDLPEVALELIERGVDIDMPKQFIQTPFFTAVSKNQIEVVKRLVERNVNIDTSIVIRGVEMTALGLARYAGYQEIIDVLEAEGALEIMSLLSKD